MILLWVDEFEAEIAADGRWIAAARLHYNDPSLPGFILSALHNKRIRLLG